MMRRFLKAKKCGGRERIRPFRLDDQAGEESEETLLIGKKWDRK